MNEEELKKGCGKRQGRGLNFYICGDLLMNVLCPTCQARLEGFQKGKLEQKKEELKFLKSIRNNQSIGMQENINRLCIPSEKLKQGYTSIELNLYLDERIEQLQKEIGG